MRRSGTSETLSRTRNGIAAVEMALICPLVLMFAHLRPPILSDVSWPLTWSCAMQPVA